MSFLFNKNIGHVVRVPLRGGGGGVAFAASPRSSPPCAAEHRMQQFACAGLCKIRCPFRLDQLVY